MAADRYALLGLARARSPWFGQVARWATSAAIPAEFTKCVSAEELRVHLRGPRPYSAVLLDGGLPAVDRDLLAVARDAGCPPLVVGDGRAERRWRELGAVAVLPGELRRELLLDALATHAVMVDDGDVVSALDPVRPGSASPPWAGDVVAVTGAGGTGASVAAMALAQGLADLEPDAEHGPAVVLADLCRHAEQAMLHDTGEVFPGLQELVEAHRGRVPSAEELRRVTYAVPDRGYQLLLGLRRARYWSTLRPRALEAALEGLRRTFRYVVCDVDADLEGEEEGGSVDVEERNLMSRAAIARASAVVVVGVPGVKGLHSLVRVIAEVADAGVPAGRVLPVVNAAPRTPRARAEVAAGLAALVGPGIAADLVAPVFLPRRKVDEALRDGVPLPEPLPVTLSRAVRAVAGRSPRPSVEPRVPERVQPGSLGSWTGEVAG